MDLNLNNWVCRGETFAPWTTGPRLWDLALIFRMRMPQFTWKANLNARSSPKGPLASSLNFNSFWVTWVKVSWHDSWVGLLIRSVRPWTLLTFEWLHTQWPSLMCKLVGRTFTSVIWIGLDLIYIYEDHFSWKIIPLINVIYISKIQYLNQRWAPHC